MARRRRSEAGRRRSQGELALKLIGAGLLVSLMPLLLSGSPVGSALKPVAPFGWLACGLGCALLWWQLRGSRARPTAVDTQEMKAAPKPFRRPIDQAPPVDRTATEFDRIAAEAASRSAPPSSAFASWDAAVFEVIEWRRFEAVVQALFAQAGFETRSQPHGADEGIDIWLYSRTKPGTPVSLVQCKHWQGKRVGVDKVRELRGVMAAKGVSRGQFATTSTLTRSRLPKRTA